MLEIIILLGIISIVLWVGYKITGTLFSVFVWLFVKLPCALLVAFIGFALCITVFLIPIGKNCFRIAIQILG